MNNPQKTITELAMELEPHCQDEARWLLSIGYIKLPDGMWQDKRGYQPPKTLQEAYDYEIEGVM